MTNIKQIDAIENCKSEIELFINYQIVDIANSLEEEIKLLEEIKYENPEVDCEDIKDVIEYYEKQIKYYNMYLLKLLR